MPNLYIGLGLPLTGAARRRWSCSGRWWSSSIRDADDDPGAFRLVSGLLVIASVLYIVPQIYGLEAADQEALGDLPSKLISTENLDVAKPIFWISIVLFFLTAGALFLRFLVRLGRPTEATSHLDLTSPLRRSPTAGGTSRPRSRPGGRPEVQPARPAAPATRVALRSGHARHRVRLPRRRRPGPAGREVQRARRRRQPPRHAALPVPPSAPRARDRPHGVGAGDAP